MLCWCEGEVCFDMWLYCVVLNLCYDWLCGWCEVFVDMLFDVFDM